MHVVRHQQILAELKKNGCVYAAALRKRFGVTAMTIWRDLELLEELGLLRKVRGGAVPVSVSQSAAEDLFEEKSAAEGKAKQRIASYAAAEFIRPGDTIVLEGGTTVAAIVDFLPKARLSILTNSLPVASKVRDVRPDMSIRIPGGWVSPISGNVTGPETLREIAKLSGDVCFLSATGFDAIVGPSDPNPLEIEVKRAWASISKRIVLLLDHGKFGVRSLAVTLHPRNLSAVVTDAVPPPEVNRLLQKWNVATHVVDLATPNSEKGTRKGRGF